MTGRADRPGNGPRRGRRPSSGGAPVYAAIDLGTNNCRLLVARRQADGFRVVDAFSRIVRLGEGVGTTGVLCEAAVQRTLGALKVCAGKMRRRGVTKGRSVATEACRRARNCDEFLHRVKSETGLELEIISAREEARLALAGVLPLMREGKPNALVFDIGGGSTELIWLELVEEGARIIGSHSIPCGVVGFAERYGSDRVCSETYAAMVQEVVPRLREFERRHQIRKKVAAGRVQVLGTSGTVTTVASVHLGLPRYDRTVVDGAVIAAADVDAVNRRLARMDYAARARLPCVGRERAELVVAGSAILEAICKTWPTDRIRVADRGLREGILLGLMGAAATGVLD